MRVRTIGEEQINVNGTGSSSSYNQCSTKIETFTYPSTLAHQDSQHATSMLIYAVEPSDLSTSSLESKQLSTTNGKFIEKCKAIFQLYMPALNTNLNHSFASKGTGFMESIVQNYKSQTNDGTTADKLIAGSNAVIGTTANVIKHNLDKLSQENNAQVSGNVVVNRAASMYEKTNLRQVVLNYQFRPRNLVELTEVGKIKTKIQELSCARNLGVQHLGDQSDGNAFGSYNKIKVPNLFYLQERIPNAVKNYNRYTAPFKFGPAALTSIRITNPDGIDTPTFDKTAGDPTAFDMELTFNELIPVYDTYFANQYDELGKASGGNDIFFGGPK